MSREMAEDFIGALRRQILPHYPQLVISKLPALPPTPAATGPADAADVESAS